MALGAWYHLDTLEQARDERLRDLWYNHELEKERFDKDPPVRWVWKSWFSIPRKRVLTQEEYLKHHDCSYQFYWLDERRIRYEERKMNDIIKLAKNSHDNIVFLDSWRVADFGTHLAPHINLKPEINIPL